MPRNGCVLSGLTAFHCRAAVAGLRKTFSESISVRDDDLTLESDMALTGAGAVVPENARTRRSGHICGGNVFIVYGGDRILRGSIVHANVHRVCQWSNGRGRGSSGQTNAFTSVFVACGTVGLPERHPLIAGVAVGAPSHKSFRPKTETARAPN